VVADFAEASTVPPDGSPPVAPAGAAAVPGYGLLRELGRGAMGVVYLARQLKVGRLVALKMLVYGGHATAKELSRFRTEAEALGRLQHPNIVQIYEVGEHGGLPFFSLEYCAGGDLDGQLDGTPWPPAKAARLVETLAKAIHAAHRAGVVHRDLKPLNIVLTTDGQPKITDFGLAKKLSREKGQTGPGAILGTPSYMAPEQAGGKSEDIGPRADVYALGAVLYELLTGRPPFKGATQLDTVLQVVSEEPVPPRQLQSKIPRDLETVCLKCLRKEPRKRYRTAAELAGDLSRFQRGAPVTARRVGPLGRGWRWCRRNPLVAASLAAVMLALAIGTAVATHFAVQSNARADNLRQHLYVAEMNLAQRAWEEGAGDARLLDVLDNQRPERIGADLRGFEWYYWWRLSHHSPFALRRQVWAGGSGKARDLAVSKGARYVAAGLSPPGAFGIGGDDLVVWDTVANRVVWSLPNTSHAGGGLAFSPDGHRLAGVTSAGLFDYRLKVWQLPSGREVVSFTQPKIKVLPGKDELLPGRARPVFSTDGNSLAAFWGQDSIKVWDAETGKEQHWVKYRPGPAAAAFNLSPDGRLACGYFDGTIKLWDLRTGAPPLALHGHTDRVTVLVFSPDGRRMASASGDRTIRIWDAISGRLEHTLRGHRTAVWTLAFSADGQSLTSFAPVNQQKGDSEIKIWDVLDGHNTFTCPWTEAPRDGDLAFGPDGACLVTGWDGIKVWDLATVEGVFTLNGRHPRVDGVVWSKDGHRVLSYGSIGGVSGRRCEVVVWDARTGAARTLAQPPRPIRALAESPDGQRLAVAVEDSTCRILDTTTGKEILALRGHGAALTSVTFTPNGEQVVTSSLDHSVKVWDLTTGQATRTIPGGNVPVHSVSVHPDGELLAMESFGPTVAVWSAVLGRRVYSVHGHAGPIWAVVFSPDGRYLASGAEDETVRVWEGPTGRELFTLQGHTARVVALAFCPHSKRLASASDDHTVKLWDLTTGRETLTLKAHSGAVTGLAFSPDGHRLASSSADGTVRIWDATPME
jgi:WD40 repeat protein